MGAEPLLIVLAEDDDGHASLVQRNLERAGLANGLERLKDGQEALDFIRGVGAFAGRDAGRQPVLLLLDIKMPRMDGLELLWRLRQSADLPVIFLTSKDEEIDELMGLNAGADDYIRKPFSQRLLLEREGGLAAP